MADKILIASGKGGVGKSTLTAFLGREIASGGKSVLLIDADMGLGALDTMLGSADKTMNTWFDVQCGNCDLKSAITAVSPNLKLLPAPGFYSGDIPDNVFVKIISECESDFDLIFIDAPAGVDGCLPNAAAACDKAVFAATADEISVKAAACASFETEKYGIKREDMRLIINRFIKKAAVKSRLLNIDGVIDKSGVRLIGIAPEDKKIPYSSVTGVYPDKKSKFAKAIKRIAARIGGENIPLVL